MLFKSVQERSVDFVDVGLRLNQDKLEFRIDFDESPLRSNRDSAILLVLPGEVLLVQEIVKGLVDGVLIDNDDGLT